MTILPQFYCAGCSKAIDKTEEALVHPHGSQGLVAVLHDDRVCILNYGARAPRYPTRRRLSKVSEWWADGIAVDPWGDRGLAKTYVEDQVAS